MTLKETPGCLTVPELKDLVGYLRGGASSARKDDLIERILVAMLGSELETAWTLLDETQQAAVAEAAHHPLGEYSDWRFRAKYQRAPAFQVAAAKSYGYSAGKRTAWCLFIQYAPDEGRHVPTDLRPHLQAFVPPPAPPAQGSRHAAGTSAARALAEVAEDDPVRRIQPCRRGENSLAAIERGHDIAELKGFLESTGGSPLPEPIESFIALCEHNGKALKTLCSALLIERRDAETAAPIAARPGTSSLCLRAGPRTLVVRTNQLAKFRERVRSIGFGMVS